MVTCTRRATLSTTLCAFVLLAALLIPRPAQAAGSGNWRTYTTDDGLLSNNIQALAYRADPLDFPPCNPPTCTTPPTIPGLWVGTDKGLTYLNGRDHVNFVDRLPAPDVRALLFDTTGKLWIATAAGLTRLADPGTPQDSNDDQWLGQVALPGLTVRTLTQTAAGQVWAGTDTGLYKLDATSGATGYTYLTDQKITALPKCPLALAATCQVGGDGQLWIGAVGGLFRLALNEPNAMPEMVSLPITLTRAVTSTTALTITALTQTADGLWVGTNKGAAHWNGKVWDTVFDGTGNLASPDVRAIDADDRGYIWFATVRGVARWQPDAHTWQHIFAGREPVPSDDMRALLIDPQGATWLGTAAGVSGNDGAWTLIDSATTYNYTSLAGNNVRTLVEDSQGRIWVGTYDGGVSVFDGQLGLLKTYNQANGMLAGNRISTLVEDSQGRIWVGTDGGVSVFDGQLGLLKTFSLANRTLAGSSVNTLVEDSQGRIWVGTLSGGVSVFDGQLGLLKTFSLANGALTDNYVSTVVEDSQGRIWVGTIAGGVSVFDGQLGLLKTFTQANGMLAANSVTTVVEDSQGRLWVGTNGGVSVFDGQLGLLKTFTTDNGALTDNDVTTLVEDSQARLWVGTDNGGVSVFDGQLGLLKTFTRANGALADNSVTTVVEDSQGRIWVGTADYSTVSGGVSVFDGQLGLLKTFTRANGALAGYGVTTVVEDRQGRIWVGTATRGVSVLDGQLGLLKTFTQANGMLAGYGVTTVVEDSQGRIWVGTNAGVSVFAPRGVTAWVRLIWPVNPVVTEQASTDRAPLKLLDTQQVELSFVGGNLLAPTTDLGYQWVLSDTLLNRVVLSGTLSPGQLGTSGSGSVTLGQPQPLAYHPHRLQFTVTDSTLQNYMPPAIAFAVQASPQFTLTQVGDIAWSLTPTPTQRAANAMFASPLSPLTAPTSPLATGQPARPPELRLPAAQLITLAWAVTDPDANGDQMTTLQVAWNYAGGVASARWEAVTANGHTAQLQLPTLQRGAADNTLALAVRLLDADGNPSAPQILTLTLLAPRSYIRLLTPYASALGAALLLLGVGLVTLARTSSLPLTLLVRQGVAQWVPTGLGYRRYRVQSAALTPLEQLLLLLAAPHAATARADFATRLAAHQAPASPAQLEQALTSLARQGLLTQVGDQYRATEPTLLRARQAHEGAAGRQQLAARVRTEHPLFATVNQFFRAAGFELTPLTDPLAFLCKPISPTWESWFNAPVYARLFPNQTLDQEAVATLQRTAQVASGREPGTLFAIIDQTPTDGGWMAIGALRSDENVQVIPIDDAFMQQARIQQKERDEFEVLLRRFRRRRDLYNVRDPVADRLNFFGRAARADELLEMLAEGRPVGLFGLRKMGKSSLLQVLGDRAGFPVAHVDLQEGLELAGIYTRTLAAWQRALRVKTPDLRWEPPPLSGDLADAFTSAVRGLLQQLEAQGLSARLGLFIDEIELLVPGETNNAAVEAAELARYLAFARVLRGLVQATGQLSLLVAGVDARLNRVNRLAGEQNPFYQFFRAEYLEPLSEADCIQMVRNIGRQMGLVYSDEAVAYVATVSGGHPFLARQLCSATLKLRGETVGSEITLTQLQTAAAQFVRDPDTASHLNEDGLWGEVTNPVLWPPLQIIENQAMLTALARTETQPEATLLAAAHEVNAREQALFELKQRAVIGRVQELLHIQFGLFRHWIGRYKL